MKSLSPTLMRREPPAYFWRLEDNLLYVEESELMDLN